MPFKSRAQKEYLRINEPEIYERWMRDYDAESFTPPASAVSAAKKGLSQRKKWGRGGLSPADAKSQGIDSGVTRARKISSGKVSRHDVRRMSAFNRHRQNNNPSKKMPDGGPTAGTIAWNLWGGTSGVNWAKKKSAAMNAEDFETMCRQCKIGNYESCLYGETVDTGGFWLSNCVPDPSMNAETFEAHACDCSNSYRYRFDRDLTAVECDRCGGYLDAHKYKVPSAGVVKYAEDEEEELNKYMVSVPVLHHYTVGPVEAYDEDEAAEDVRENWSEWRRTIDNNGDWGGPMWRYLPWYDADPEAYEVFDSETFGDVDSDGQLAQALARARAKSQEPRRPLKITKLPHQDQTSLKDFEAESNTPLFTKESKVFAIGLASGIVATIFGNLLSEFVIDRYREDPELSDTEQNA